ncbi:winged helix DNA-binding protein [Kribbella amoyensis]|uniref:Winged helix DNA-binding protein n=1 Tax=Kribbella amoyensis TaxID=996641 RepID=A0A561BJF6_9ACTN|nr:transcriptional regulator [Kribbella amoyensis]TWD78987.1 winged helix DNA-binding protein [Kribbella amoyensis]
MINGLDPVIHTPKRLAAMAVLANSTTASFRFLRNYLDISDSDLSKHMSALEAAGYVHSAKDGRGRGATTTFKLTRDGQKAYNAHRDALRALLDGPSPEDLPQD